MRLAPTTSILLATLTIIAGTAGVAPAQRGRGEAQGVARKGLKAELVPLSGKVLAVKKGPCEMTTGRATMGTHVVLETGEGTEWNIHLGPAEAVEELADLLARGTRITVRGFQADKLPEKHYVAQVVTIGERSFRLRDEKLRPVWGQQRGERRKPWRRMGFRIPTSETRGTFEAPVEPVVGMGIRVVYQIKTDAWKDGHAAGLHYLGKLADQYEALGIKPSEQRIHGVFHGDAGYFLLADEAYRAETDGSKPNPNAELVSKLVSRGIQLELCKSTMKSHGWTGDDVLPGVEIVVAAYPRIIDLQLRGYAYIRF